MLGGVLEDVGPPRLFETVERARLAARRRRRGSPEADEELAVALRGLDNTLALEVVRAFSSYFGLVNMAERVHRLRRRNAYLRDGDDQPGAFRAVLRILRSQGVTIEELRERVGAVCLEPVFTAHPTEAVRRTLLHKDQRIARALIERFHYESMTPGQQAANEERILLEITTGFLTDEQLRDRPTVAEEVEHVLFYLTDVVYRIVPDLHDDLERAVRVVYGDELGIARPLVRFGSWVGGDMDGNPNVGAATIRETLGRQFELIVSKYRIEIRRLFDHLSQSETRARFTALLRARIERYEAMFPESFAAIPSRYREMPYRVFLWLVSARLDATLAGENTRYEGPDGFRDDLQVLSESLLQCGGARSGAAIVRRLLMRLATFGFHLATLDVRQDSRVHGEVLAEVRAGTQPLSDAARATLEVFDALKDARARYGTDASGVYVISMARQASDALAVLDLAEHAGFVDESGGVPLDIAPLFETVDDLRNASSTLRALTADPRYAAHLARRGQAQLVMLGYSDSNKDGGIAASRWALQRAQIELVEAAHDAGVELSFFHGRGGSISRGGGKPRNAILAAPTGAVRGRVRMTEQGEILHAKYGLRGIAERTLELGVGALLERSDLTEVRDAESPDSKWALAMDLLATESRRAYRQLVHEDPDFPDFFRLATPIDVIERLRIGSRPAKRRAMRGIEDLRAIPWVFAWTQSRLVLPGWFGVGSGLAAVEREFGLEFLRALARDWPCLATLLADVEMVCAKADLRVAERYARLAGEVGERLFPQCRSEFERTTAALLRVLGQRELLERDPTLQRSIQLRNPYVDPISLLQVDLLAQWRATNREDAELESVLGQTVRGIARGLQNTG
ncbi:MAG: phosphoenolpyruvate carboxylase [Planctomycetes bacterium]|nr:phosphoenolpyruvate carboxylase [Planctomycetota bacterium]MCB9891620.1 phosphoenolpyruvate carboxylase [Planctomycetota bacterium]MCB9917883.1 phosphoenolpyruvate carboxylase [Planctomycetota bacterium]